MAVLSRRAFLRRSSAAVLAVPLLAATARTAVAAPAGFPELEVRPRSAWAEGLPAAAGLAQERPGDVRFVIVHHSASPNGYAAGEVPGILRGFHSFHTGADKGWPDVAYNFFVDRFGTVWEGRTGSLAGPVQPDATGGSQGFSQICCFIGDHTTEPPTPEAQRAMTLLLAGLAQRYGIDPAPGATTTFVSRGSNRWPAGTSITAPTIAGHRDMSLTTCPGDAAYAVVREVFPAGVAAVLAARATPTAATPSPTEPPATPSPTGTQAPESTSSAPPTAGSSAAAEDDGIDPASVTLIGAGAAATGAAAVLLHRLRGRGRPDESPPH